MVNNRAGSSPVAGTISHMSKYKSITHIEVQGFDVDDDGLVPVENETSLEPSEPLLSVQLASILHGSCQRIDHLNGDGLWVHGAVGV